LGASSEGENQCSGELQVGYTRDLSTGPWKLRDAREQGRGGVVSPVEAILPTGTIKGAQCPLALQVGERSESQIRVGHPKKRSRRLQRSFNGQEKLSAPPGQRGALKGAGRGGYVKALFK